MDFINDNYVWFIVIGVILFMALIGYIAEKTDFGRSQFEKRVKREPKPKKEKVKKASTTVIEELPVAEANVENAIDEAVVIEDDDWLKPLEEPIDFMENNNETNEENLTVPLEGINPAAEENLTVPLNEVSEVEEDLTVPLEGINPVVEEDLTVPLEGIEPVVIEDLKVPLNEVSEVEEDLPFGDNVVEPVINEIVEPLESVNTDILEESKEELNLPNIDDLNKDEDDVWKF